MSEVAEELGIQTSFMTVIVAKLLKRKLITVTKDKKDQRKKYIALAPEGQKILALMQRQFEEFFAPLTRGLSKSELASYLKVLTTIIANVEQQNELK